MSTPEAPDARTAVAFNALHSGGKHVHVRVAMKDGRGLSVLKAGCAHVMCFRTTSTATVVGRGLYRPALPGGTT